MGFTNLFSFLFYVLLLRIISLTLGQDCSQTAGNFTTNSIYGRNLNLILSSLASNASANGGFYNTTTGQEPNKVYAVAVCRGDSSSACAECVSSAVKDMMTNCPNHVEAISWRSSGPGPCFVRYANRSFSGILEMDPLTSGYNTGEITSNLTEFDQSWEPLMDRVIIKASTGSSRNKFGTGEADLTLFQKIYAMMQCTPYLSQSDCDICLRRSVAAYQSCCHGKQGGYVSTPSCSFRWDLYPFYEVLAEAPPPAPFPPPPSPLKQNNTTVTEGKGSNTDRTVITTVVPIIIVVMLIICICIFLRRRKPKEKVRSEGVDEDEITKEKSLQFDFNTIKVATDNFSDANRLGQGGFGAVYKGRLSDEQDIAVKRLSRSSGQGDLEFKNEVLLVARLQHRHLVRLLGFSLEGTERLLIYEFLPNTSLDHFIFDANKRAQLDWDRRYKIIGGVARGLLYLHEDSRLRIIHRDMKASNILLDADMNPKIADFGMARLFERDETQGNTSRIVGTYGYMAPEYAMHGQFSVKSDVYSFGVLVLEIVSGQKNNFLRNGEDLLSNAWKNWREGRALDIIDPTLNNGSRTEMIRCIHIGLLCVTENVVNRPTMASIALMLNSYSLTLPVPSKPAFFMHNTLSDISSSGDYTSRSTESNQSRSETLPHSQNELSITELHPR